LEILHRASIGRFGVRVHGAGEDPERLRQAEHPVELLYFQGWWDLVESRGVAVVGTREPSDDGIRRAEKLVRNLVRDGFTIVSGLAKGIDTTAHETAIREGGLTIAVIGTPLSRVYPIDNRDLQERIARDYLLISQRLG
jgi:DNA processing protein